MKTNKIMIRKMGSYKVKQRTIDGMFNATELLKQWNTIKMAKKDVDDFLSLKQTKAFLEVLQTEEELNTHDCGYLRTRGKQGGTWMHPVLFIKFAMWINPRFEYFVIRFVYDQLIEYRHSAGDNYRGLASAIQRFDGVDFGRVAKGLNYIVFGIHEHELRQTATPEQLKSLTELQKQLAFAVDMGYIRTFDELINEMRRIYKMRNAYKF